MGKHVALVAALMLTACGGGNSPPAPAQNPPPPTLPTLPDAAGIWAGTYFPEPGVALPDDGLCRITLPNASPSEITCIFFQNGEVAVALQGTRGTLVVAANDQDWQHSGVVYDFGRGPHVATLTSGHVDGSAPGRSIDLEHDLDDGTSLGFNGEDVDQSGLSASAFGVYQAGYMRGSFASFSIAADGEIFAQDTTCTMNGFANQLAMYGYFLEVDLTNCGVPNGRYTGFGIHTHAMFARDSGGYTELFAFALFDGEHWIGGHALR